MAGVHLSIAELKKLKYLSISQSLLYPECYTVTEDCFNDESFIEIFKGCRNLKDIYMGSFHALSNATWQV